ncbi:MAG TPA: GAF domain-containing SpoIIE family protein phosphatase [Vicinamibacteria bacterium]|nr:GAF domain-containing SpoIIE family protein phosphatase [Vicinamibacteria bacterium]
MPAPSLFPPQGEETSEQLRQALALQAKTVERLRFLIEASKVLNSTLDLAEVIRNILDMTTRETGAERATLFLLDHEKNELWSLVAQGLEQKEIRLPAGKGLAGWIAETGQVVNLPDAHEDPRFDRSFDGLFGYRTRALLGAPVKDRDGRVVGVLELLNKPAPGFSSEDLEFLDGISVHAAIALENARLHRESMYRQKLDRELALARTIQQGLLPEAPPNLPGFDIAVRHTTSQYVGGDYYDFIPISPTVHLFVVADVEGKGPSSALVMSNLQATLHVVARHVHSLEGIMFHVNEGIQLSTHGEKFLTLFLGLLDVPRRVLHYVNAGHVPPLVVREGSQVVSLREGGMVLGLLPQIRYKRGIVQLEKGDVVLACTDGITEAGNQLDELWGAARLVQAGIAHWGRPAREIVDSIFDEVAAFAAGGTQTDDKILMAIKLC